MGKDFLFQSTLHNKKILNHEKGYRRVLKRDSSRDVSRSCLGGGGLKSLCIKIAYSEPRRVFNSSRELPRNVILDSDGLPTLYPILIGCRDYLGDSDALR